MKLALAVCMALLAVVLVQAADEMAPPRVPAGTRIVNGTPAEPRQFPYMAHIVGYYYCAGSLITRAVVLTTAYGCVHDATKWIVRLGSIYRTEEDPNAWTVESVSAMTHPNYNYNDLDNNIAIIHLPRLAPVNEFIQPVYLPSSTDNSSYLGHEGIVSGWGWTHDGSGMSDVLRWAEVLIIPNKYCKKFGGSLAVTDRQLCAGGFTTTVRADDRGAPLVLNMTGRYIQIGIMSLLTTYQYNTSHPAIYTRVASFLDWIKLYTEFD